ncbi:MAG: glycerophosphodiester phosphodiesterase family protein [Anaerovoracaceae bacterium]|jgi:glycerophosphoryl diester phosphodiesterase
MAFFIVPAVLIAAAAVFALHLFLIAPNHGRRAAMRPYEENFLAHRGLFDNRGGCPENSLPAFRKAVEAGYGVELDVQMTADDRLVVFHDAGLQRMCGVDLTLTDLTWEELQRYPLLNSGETIPLFDDVLDILDGRVPLLVEIKAEGDYLRTCAAAAARMDRYPGSYLMESFHPLAVRWFRLHRPQVLRGQLASDFLRDPIPESLPLRFGGANLLGNFLSRPDFIAYNHHYADQRSYRLCRRIFRPENAAWTVRSEEELRQARKVFQIIIFDSFRPQRNLERAEEEEPRG